MRNIKKVLCFMAVLVLLTGCAGTPADPSAPSTPPATPTVNEVTVEAVDIEKLNSFLLEAAFPQEAVDQMPIAQKLMIYEYSEGKSVRFHSRYTQNVNFAPDGESGLAIRNLVLSVVCTAYEEDGKTVYAIYPAYQSDKGTAEAAKFSAKMYDGWEVIPGQREFRLYTLDDAGQPVKYAEIEAQTAGAGGYSYQVPTGVGKDSAVYSGCGYFAAEMTKEDALEVVLLTYINGAAYVNRTFTLKQK